jgi:iron(III) transport system substrate-binding protein
MNFSFVRFLNALALVTAIAFSAPSSAQLNVYCSYQKDWREAMKNAFEKSSGVKVNVSQKSSGETFAQIRAEAANPKGDVWWVGTADPHVQAAADGLTKPYVSANTAKLHPWARKLAEQTKNHAVGVYAGPLGLGHNPELLKKKGIAPPACWKDLLDAKFKDEIQISNPLSSGTAYVAIATFVQLMGEEPAFAYLKSLNANVNQYPKSGAGPVKAVGRGETAVGISFIHDAVAEANAGLPVVSAAPCEGTGYEIGAMSTIKGARNLENAKKWFDWALTPEAQALGAQANSFPVPSNPSTPLHPKMPKFESIKLINYDFAKYGAADERKRLLARWEAEIGAMKK